jgi:hypothetical protein
VSAGLSILGGAVFGVLGALHALYTLLDLGDPRRLVPADPSVRHAMANSALKLSRGATDIWRVWVGINLTHSLGLLLLAAVAVWAGARVGGVSSSLMLGLTLVGCTYLIIALVYFYRVPAIGVAIGTGCFAVAWLMSLR